MSADPERQVEFEDQLFNLDAAQGRMAGDLRSLAARVAALEDECSGIRAMIKGQPPDEDGGLFKRIHTVEQAVKEINFIKWGVVALILMKSPDIFAMIKPILAHF